MTDTSVAKRTKSKKSVHALTIYEQIGKNTKPTLFPEQLIHILQSTPKNHIYKRAAKGGGEWEYVTGAYVKKVLNYVFAWNWDFEIKDKGTEGDLLWVLGRLTVRTKSGVTIVKEQFGRADMKKKRDGTGYLDYGNDLKAAATDALKKCASELGIASDVYAKNEFKEVQLVKEEENPMIIVKDPSEPATPEQIATIKTLRASRKLEAIDEGLLASFTKQQAVEEIQSLSTKK